VTGRRTADEVVAFTWDPPQPPETLMVTDMFVLCRASLGEG